MRTRFPVLSSILALLAVAVILALVLPREAEAEQCENARIVSFYADGHPAGIEDPGYMELGWSLDINPWPDDFYLEEEVYNIQRRPADSKIWEFVATVNDGTHWEGAPSPGRWVYHVGLVSLRANGDTETCNGVVAETTLDLPTEAELAPELLGLLCERSEVVRLKVVRPDDGSLMLKWEDSLDHFYEYVEDDLRGWGRDAATFKADTVVYRVQRSATARDNTPLGWTTLAETTERTWTGPAEPGRWAYRVDTIRMTKGSIAVDCETWHAEVQLHIQTAEEIAEQAQQMAILQAEAVRCATATLTSSQSTLEGQG
ncbi:MAG: hypothetical protein OXF79_02580 [Chloroflexi bacterium]|nr:hypothetical protein [Chloroflexota bacterium]